MKRLLLILSLTLGLANPVFALERGERHADPYKVMTQGQVIGEEINTKSNGYPYSRLLIAYQDEMYRCALTDNDYYFCILLEPKIN